MQSSSVQFALLTSPALQRLFLPFSPANVIDTHAAEETGPETKTRRSTVPLRRGEGRVQ